MNTKILLYESFGTSCPYLPNRIWKTRFFGAEKFSGALYEALLSQGFRRSGTRFYQNCCPSCEECRQIRVPVAEFTPTKSQRRVWRLNNDLTVSLEPAVFEDETFDLYLRYTAYKHEKEHILKEDFIGFLCGSPIDSRIMKYRRENRLVGAGWLDFLSRGISSVYFAFDPDFASRSLGTFSILKEIELARSLDKLWYYLGFCVEGSAKMSYKSRFRPHDRLQNGTWHRVPSHTALAATKPILYTSKSALD
jgi:arginine-tRNA-protein transferase